MEFGGGADAVAAEWGSLLGWQDRVSISAASTTRPQCFQLRYSISKCLSMRQVIHVSVAPGV
jgi:hypothetical protein